MLLRLVLVLMALAMAGPAAAHNLRVFIRADAGGVSGYGFFIGGGRPAGAEWTAVMGGTTIAAGMTGPGGEFAFPLPQPVQGDITVTVNTGEGHVATAALPAARIGGAIAAPAPPSNRPAMVPPPDETARLVEAAVAVQIAPLMERIEQMDARMRLTDILSGIFLILGLAGGALWARGRRG